MRASLSLTARVSLLFAVAAAAVLFLAGAMFEHAAENHFLEDDREELSGKTDLIRNLLANADTAAAKAQLKTRIADAMFGHPGIAISIASTDGSVIYSTGPDAVVKHMLAGGELGQAQPATWSNGGNFYRIMGNRLALGLTDRAPVNVAVALDITDDHTFLTEFTESLWFGMALATVLMALLGWIAVYRGLLPLRKLSDDVAAISAERLHTPLMEEGMPAELRGLVRAFNRMLSRLEESFRQISEFSADLAHELRTPIQNLLMETQVTLSRQRDATEYRANLHSNLEELERLSRMTTDMLFLAKADNRLLALKKEPVELREETERLLSFYEAFASDRGVTLSVAGAATVIGDKLMIQRALSNLLSNAIRFTPSGNVVSVQLAEAAGAAAITVTNPGPQIPADHLPRIFERFHRVDPARQEGESQHAGLGLAIVKSIAESHGGGVQAESSTLGTRFTITLARS